LRKRARVEVFPHERDEPAIGAKVHDGPDREGFARRRDPAAHLVLGEERVRSRFGQRHRRKFLRAERRVLPRFGRAPTNRLPPDETKRLVALRYERELHERVFDEQIAERFPVLAHGATLEFTKEVARRSELLHGKVLSGKIGILIPVHDLYGMWIPFVNGRPW
jgi:hypothetical protein